MTDSLDEVTSGYRSEHKNTTPPPSQRPTTTTMNTCTATTAIADKERARRFPPGGGTTEAAADASKTDKEAAAEPEEDGQGDYRSRHRRVPLGQEGWRVCLVTACLPVILPWRAREQHKNITELYPVESTGTRKVWMTRVEFQTLTGDSIWKRATCADTSLDRWPNVHNNQAKHFQVVFSKGDREDGKHSERAQKEPPPSLALHYCCNYYHSNVRVMNCRQLILVLCWAGRATPRRDPSR